MMNKILTYTLREEDLEFTAGGLVNLILKNCMHVTGHEVSRAKYTPDGITADGKQTRVSERILPGQTLQVILPEDPKKNGKMIPQTGALPGGGPLEVLYEDEDLILVNKPAGIVVHPSPGHYMDTMANYIAGYFLEKGENTACRIIGRLDKETSGILIYAKNRAAAARLTRGRAKMSEEVSAEANVPETDAEFNSVTQMTKTDAEGHEDTMAALPAGKQHTDAPHNRKRTESSDAYQRIYYALAEGVFRKTEGVIESRMDSTPDVLLKRRIVEEGEGYAARTHYRVIVQSPAAALVELHIDTGRTHQIRLHLASIGHPVIGDTIYGSDAHRIQGEEEIARGHYVSMPGPARKEDTDHGRTGSENLPSRAMLHAGRLRVRQPFTGELLEVTAPFPEDFIEACRRVNLHPV